MDDVERALGRGARRHGAVVAGVLRGGEQLVRGWSADGPPPDGDRLFEIGSITKVLTGVLLADMTLRGEVSLSDPLSRHLPDVRPAWRHREPTLLDLATHRSGLPNVPRPMARGELRYALGLSPTDPWAGVTEQTYRGYVTRESPRRAPGRKVRYSSLGVGLLGDALAARAGTSYEELLTDRVLAPLGMNDTAVTVPPGSRDRLLGGHSARGRPRPPLQDFMPAAGSLRSSAEDMLRFLAACLQPADDALGKAIRLARNPQARLAKRMSIGLCWLVLERPGKPVVIWHNGGTWGFRAWAGFSTQTGVAAVVMSNTARSVDRLGFRLVEGGARKGVQG